ncbi:MAG: tetratricopeptide repeat protein [Gemmatimonadales bacterium]|jgi:tetratricopeptide (TPR) repeat protein
MPPDNDVQQEIEQLERRYAEHSQGLVFAHLADAYRRAGEYGKAEGLILHGLRNHPKYISAYNVLGRVYIDSERFADAHEQFSKVLELDPQNMIAMKALGDLALRGGRLEDARSWFERILQLDPRNEEVQEELQKLAEGGVSSAPAPAAPPEAPPEMPGEPEAPGEIAEPEVPEVLEEEGPPWDLGGMPEEEEEEGVEFSAEPVEGLIGKGQQVELGDVADVPDSVPDIAPEGPSGLEPPAAETPDEPPHVEGLEALDSLGAAEEPRREIDLGDMDDWTPGFLREEDMEGQAGDDLGVGSLRDEFGAGDEGVGEEPEAVDTSSDGMLTDTMAELYADQGLYEDALGVYRELAKTRPEDESLRARIAELEQKFAEARTEGGADELAELLDLTDIATPEEQGFPEAPEFPEEPTFPDSPVSPEAPPELAASQEAAAAAPEEALPSGEFNFEDEAPVAGMEHLDPFAASFDVMVKRGDAQMPAGVGGLGDLTRDEPAEAPPAPDMAPEPPEPELEIVPTIDETPPDLDVAPAPDVLPPGAAVTPFPEAPPPEPEPPLPETAEPVTEAPEPAAEAPTPSPPRAQPSAAPTIEEYLAGLLAFDQETPASQPGVGPETAEPPADMAKPSGPSDAAEAADASSSEDLEQFQEWLRSLKE